MTEYQKMLGGQLYNAQDGELQAMHRLSLIHIFPGGSPAFPAGQ